MAYPNPYPAPNRDLGSLNEDSFGGRYRGGRGGRGKSGGWVRSGREGGGWNVWGGRWGAGWRD